MPIYEYECSSCGHELEALQKISDEALTDCPKCDNSTLVKKISAAAFRLAGSGWYETDFKSGNKNNLAGDASKPSDSSSKKDASNSGSTKTGSTTTSSATKGADTSSNGSSSAKAS